MLLFLIFYDKNPKEPSMKKTLFLTAVITSSLFAASLQQQALSMGLAAIPSDKKALKKLIDPNKTMTKAKVALGKKLFFDPRLSKSGFISCNSCHNLAMGGADGLEAAVGHRWTVNPHHLNSPTVYNAVFFDKQFWDGRSPHLEDQAQGPIQAGPEMAAPKDHVVKTVSSMPQYVADFKKAYGKKAIITFERLTDTIGIFERTLVTPSRFDAFLEGKSKALSKTEKRGLKLFLNKGCVSCHNGIALGGSMNTFNFTDYNYKAGDFKGDKSGMVKVPTLRNVAQTAPYFHNGKVWTLKEAIIEMGRIQLGTTISNHEAKEIEAFLKSLTGKKGHIAYPQLPEVTAKTPRPQL
jgi:cytochrome c peroxidase